MLRKVDGLVKDGNNVFGRSDVFMDSFLLLAFVLLYGHSALEQCMCTCSVWSYCKSYICS
jgi:hypothetical protein